MNRSKLLISTFFMFLTAETLAQQKHVSPIKWEIAGELPATSGQPRSLGVAGPITGVHNEMMIVGGGANFPGSMPWEGGKKSYSSELFVFKKTKPDSLVIYKSLHLPYPLAYSANCSTPQGIVAAGGENDNGISKKVMLLTWNSVTEDISIRTLPDLPVAVTNAVAVAYNNLVYLAGGETATTASDKFYCLDLNSPNDGWDELPPIPKPVSHAVIAVQSNGKNECIYLLGGRRKNANGISDLYNSVFEFDLTQKHWQQKKALPYALCAGTGIATGLDEIVLFGGDKGTTFHEVEKFIAAITAEKNETKKQGLILQKNNLQITHPGFSREVLVYNTRIDSWSIIDSIPYPSPVTTTAFRWKNEVFIPSGEIKAGVRSPTILSGKINFSSQ